MANLKNVIYISNEDYATLIATGSVTIGGVTLTYDEDNVYITPETLASSSADGLMSAADKTKLDNIDLSVYAPKNHASSATTYGIGTTTNYGHVKLQSGNINGTSATDGIAAGLGHTHSNYIAHPANTAAGDIIYYTGANTVARLAKGSADTILTSDGSGGISWKSEGLKSYSATATGRITYLEGATYTSAAVDGTENFVTAINGGAGSFTPTAKYMHASYTAGTAYTSSTEKFMHWSAGSMPSRTEKSVVTGYETAPSFNFSTETVTDNKYVWDISSTGASGTPSTKYLHTTNEEAITAINGGSGTFSGARSETGSGDSARRTLTISHSHTAASASTKVSFLKTLSANTTATDGIQYLESYSVSGGTATPTYHYAKFTAGSLKNETIGTMSTAGSAPSLTFNTTSTDGQAFIAALQSGSVGGSVTLAGNDTAANGVTYLESATHTHTGASVSQTQAGVTSLTSGTFTPTTKYLDIERT